MSLIIPCAACGGVVGGVRYESAKGPCCSVPCLLDAGVVEPQRVTSTEELNASGLDRSPADPAVYGAETPVPGTVVALR